ncbi:hypothetical protein [Stenotrophomonas pictorum]|uniref:hypothetical protein n=1 Tax=Stenotrophomonas pictorum TaxID=86184 RepID=UPI000A722D3C|nr:hypothetical protein [Stenotrophomonas pictorum]
MERLHRPFFPIIYVRGYAMTRGEIVETTSTPFMGFEAGSTKMRQAQDGSIVKFVFESPLVRLMKDYDYRDVYESGAERRDRLSPRCIVIHRYYDPADPAFGDGKAPSIADAARSWADASSNCATASAAAMPKRARTSASTWWPIRWAG